ncbi:hypothetical protein H0H81_007762, partial [Sphagnurus paluster]
MIQEAEGEIGGGTGGGNEQTVEAGGQTSIEQVEDEDEEMVIWGAIEELERAVASTAYATRSKGKKVEGQQVEKVTKKKTDEETRAKDEEVEKRNTINEEEEKKKNNVKNTVKGKMEKGEARGEMKNYLPKFEPPQPAYTYESKAADPDAAQKFFCRITEAIVPNITVGDLLSLSGELRKEVVENLRTVRVPNPNVQQATAAVVQTTKINPRDIPLDFMTPLREVGVEVGGKSVDALLDEGSEIVVVRRDLWEELGLEVNVERLMVMETANGGKEKMGGCSEFMEIVVDGMTTWGHAYVVPHAPFKLLLGRPWQRSVLLSKVETEDDVFVTVRDPLDRTRRRTVATKERPNGGRVLMYR